MKENRSYYWVTYVTSVLWVAWICTFIDGIWRNVASKQRLRTRTLGYPHNPSSPSGRDWKKKMVRQQNECWLFLGRPLHKMIQKWIDVCRGNETANAKATKEKFSALSSSTVSNEKRIVDSGWLIGESTCVLSSQSSTASILDDDSALIGNYRAT